ncbi:unnamed protein product [Penicillium pancosmium]
MKMSFTYLPTEILYLIEDYLHSASDLFSLIRTSRRFYDVLKSELYKKNVKSDGGSAIVWYARQGNDVGVRGMLAAGADVNIRPLSRDQSTALIVAITHKHATIVKTLLENGAAPDAADLRSKRPLTLAASERSDPIITQLLLDHGAKPGAIASDKRAPLLEAILSNQESKAAMLLKYGADAKLIEFRDRRNLLHVAAVKNASPTLLGVLIKSGISVESRDFHGRTPLQAAVEHSCTRAVRVLLQHGADPNAKNERNGLSALFCAACPKNSRSDNKTIIRTLVTGAKKQAQELIEVGASIHARNLDTESILHLAASSFVVTPDIITWLVENGADINWIGGKQHETPLFYAIARSKYSSPNVKSMASIMLSLGSDANFRNIDGMTPLSFAARQCSISLSELLIQHGASVNSMDMQKKTPLHHVFDSKYESASAKREMVSFLIRFGAAVNSRDANGYTPLHKAVATGWTWEIVGDLLNAGADRCVMSDDGKFPYDMIPDGPWAETQRLILRHYPA